MFRNANQRDWAIVGIVCLLAAVLFVGSMGVSTAGEVPQKVISSPIKAKAGTSNNQVPDCTMPVPAPACNVGNNGRTLCIEGDNCHAVSFTCGGVPTVWGPAARCSFNACTGTPGSVGSKCQ